MTRKQPKQLVNSEYERAENDAYFTDHWMTRALLRHMPVERSGKIIYVDPACGRGDIMAPLHAAGAMRVLGVDIDVPHKRFKATGMAYSECNFLEDSFENKPDAKLIYVANPPFGPLAQKFLVRCLEDERATKVAFLLRSLWNTSPGRKNSRLALFNKSCARFDMAYAYEIVLTERPVWDWWYRAAPKRGEKRNKPFHSYSWHVWDRNWKGPSTQFWEGNDGKGRVEL